MYSHQDFLKLDKNLILKKEKQERTKWMWIVLIGCLFLQMFPFSIAMNMDGLFMNEWLIWDGQNVLLIGIGYSIGALCSAVFGPSIAKLLKCKINEKFIYSFGVIICCLGFGFPGIISAIKASGSLINVPSVIAILWFGKIFINVGALIFSGLGVNNLITKWWPPERRGLALGIAFSGGSIGNILIQQGTKPLFAHFANQENGSYFVYLIMTLIGLFFGLMTIIFMVKKPLPSTNILMGENINKKVSTNNNYVTPLETFKYPAFWLLCVGFLILQFGTTHVKLSTVIVEHGIAFGDGINFTHQQLRSIESNGLTIYAVSCLFGNFFGGIVTDKIGVARSILLAGIMQFLATFVMMYSVNQYQLIYIYFLLSGLSVYILSSFASYTCGNLFGAKFSTEILAVVSIFVSIGFAIINILYGTLTGNTDQSNINDLFGVPTEGNFLLWGIFTMTSIAIGSIIIALAAFMIKRKGYEGLRNYNNSKFVILYTLKYAFVNKIKVCYILLCKKDFRNNVKYQHKIEHLKLEDELYLWQDQVTNLIKHHATKLGLENKEIKIFTMIFINCLTKKDDLVDHLAIINSLKKKKFIDELIINESRTYYCVDKQKYQQIIQDLALDKKITKIILENEKFEKRVWKIRISTTKKINKVATHIDQLRLKLGTISINQADIIKSDNKLTQLKNRIAQQATKIAQMNDWDKFKFYILSNEKAKNINHLKHKREDQLLTKINQAQAKINILNFKELFKINEEVIGCDKLHNFYNDKYKYINLDINQTINNKYYNAINKLENKKQSVITLLEQFKD